VAVWPASAAARPGSATQQIPDSQQAATSGPAASATGLGLAAIGAITAVDIVASARAHDHAATPRAHVPAGGQADGQLLLFKPQFMVYRNRLVAREARQAAAARRARRAAAQRRAAARAAARQAAEAARSAARDQSTQAAAPATAQPSGSPQQIAMAMLGSYGWSSSEFSCLNALWSRESGWNPTAANASGAYGIPQALPGSKMASAGADWQTNPATQIRWGLGYIKGLYGSPCGAWSHSEATGWY